MKKSMIFVGMLALGYANAQEERVGINTESPSATLNVKTKTNATSPKNLELENQAGTKLMTVLNNGRVGINNPSPEYILDIKAKDDTFEQNNIIVRSGRGIIDSSNEGTSGVTFFRSNGTVDNPTTLRVSDYMSGIGQYGYDGTGYRHSSFINTMVTGEIADNRIPSSIIFGVEGGIEGKLLRAKAKAPDMIIHHTGNVGINLGLTTISSTPRIIMPIKPLEKLHIGGAIKLSTEYSRSTISDGAKTPVPNGGAGTIIHQNGHFFGWVSDTNGWKQLDNEASASTSATSVKLDNIKDNKPICNDTTVGTISFGTITANGKSTDAFGFCMKNSDGQAKWFYIYGGSAATGGGSGEFGAGL